MVDSTTHTTGQGQAQKMENLGFIASGIVHDFNNLLTSILGETSLALLKLSPDDSARLHIERAEAAAKYAARLTYNLLSYVNENHAYVDAVDLNQLVQDNVSLLGTLLDSIEVQLELAPQLLPVEAKLGHVQQVVMNLVINATQAMCLRPGSLTIQTGVKRFLPNNGCYQLVRGGKLPPGEYTFLRVSDTGVGIDKATLRQISEPFFTTKTNGRGIGLATVMNILESYQGGLCVTSKPGCGTTFTAYFPSSGSANTQHKPCSRTQIEL